MHFLSLYKIEPRMLHLSHPAPHWPAPGTHLSSHCPSKVVATWGGYAAPSLCLWTSQYFYMVASWGRGSFLAPGANVPPGCCTWVLCVSCSGLPSLSSPTCTKRVAADHRGSLGCSAGGWEVAKQWPGCGCLN